MKFDPFEFSPTSNAILDSASFQLKKAGKGKPVNVKLREVGKREVLWSRKIKPDLEISESWKTVKFIIDPPIELQGGKTYVFKFTKAR